jgi:hypothetical protein
MSNLTLTIIIFLLTIIFGFISPRRFGWYVLFILPLVVNINFKIIPGVYADFTIERAALGITIGMIMSGYKDVKYTYLFRSIFIQLYLLFNIIYIIIIYGVNTKAIIGSVIPGILISIVLCYILIRDKKDILKLISVYSWQSAIIGLFIIIEYFTTFNVYEYIKEYDPEYTGETIIISKKYFMYVRGDIYRAVGIDGDPTKTGFRLAMMFPIVFWYAKNKTTRYKLPIVLVIVGILLLQTRATYVAIIVSGILIAIEMVRLNRKSIYLYISYVGRITIATSIALFIIIIFIPSLTRTFSSFFLFSTGYDGIESMMLKIDRIPIAFYHFMNNPFGGYGPPAYVYETVMQNEDIPAIVVYFLSGGIIMGVIYLSMMFTMPISILRLRHKAEIDIKDSIMLIFISAALFSGVVVLFANWIESHLIFMYMLYISVYKVYVINPQNTINYNN